MADEQKQSGQAQIQIVTGDEMSRGRYSNNMMVTHSPEEFIIDWLLNSPGGTHLVARIIISPGHLKRVIGALTDNLRIFEQQHGTAREIEPKDQVFH
jgi:hypothetical protein